MNIACKPLFDQIRHLAVVHVGSIAKSLKSSLWDISFILMVFSPFMSIIITYYFGYRLASAIAGIVLFVVGILRIIDEAVNDETKGIPVPRKKFIVDQGDYVEIENGNINEVVLYLFELQEYLEKKGLLK